MTFVSTCTSVRYILVHVHTCIICVSLYVASRQNYAMLTFPLFPVILLVNVIINEQQCL